MSRAGRLACLLAVTAAGCGFQHGVVTGDGGSTRDAPDGQPGDAPDAPPSQTSHARMIDVTDAEVIGGPHANFPLLVSLQETWLRNVSQGGAVESPQAYDVVFTADAQGATRLAHEIERYDAATGRLVAWVKVPSLASSTVLYIRYGDASITTSQENVAAVWSGGFAGVWHLDGLTDSAGTNLGTDGGPLQGAAQIGYGRTFDGVDDYIDTGSGTAIDDVFAAGGTAEGWVYAATFGESTRGRLFEKGDATAGNGTAGWLLSVDNTNVAQSVFFAHNSTGGLGGWNAPSGSFALGAWNQIAVVYDQSSAGNNAQIFINGIAVTVTETFTPSGTMASDAALSLRIGNRIAGDRTFDGTLDEARLSTVPRSAGWIETSYRNQHAPGAFSTVGPELP
ncbi:MAG TPA: DUF2341 domain-containing protein [Kofleriaceae bacterium]|nr:DUF2341 domain-containing protein [Kofleriaceae bacterium]